MKTAGIIGGLGPQSTALFYEEVIRIAQQREVVEYPRMIINSMSIWDFAECMNDPVRLFMLLSGEMGRIEGEVDYLAMVCNTAHCIVDHLRAHSRVPILAIQEEVVKRVRAAGLRKVGVIGTKITSRSGFYARELDRYGIESVTLPDQVLDQFNQLIFREMLRGESYDSMHIELAKHCNLLVDQGCEGIILACTELPLFIQQQEVSVPLFPSTHILAEAVVRECLKGEERIPSMEMPGRSQAAY